MYVYVYVCIYLFIYIYIYIYIYIFIILAYVSVAGRVSSAHANSGRAASLTAPSAPALQQVISDAVRHALLSPLDVDAVECDAKGSLMHDAVEVVSIAKQLRGVAKGDEEVLQLGSTKSKLGYTQETSGVASFVATLMQQRAGHLPGNLHMKALNPHAFPEDEDPPLKKNKYLWIPFGDHLLNFERYRED